MNVPVYLDPQFLQNGTTNFDETLHVAQACTEEGFGTTGTSGYSPVQILEPKNCSQKKCSDVQICPFVRICPDLCPMSGCMSQNQKEGGRRPPLHASLPNQQNSNVQKW